MNSLAGRFISAWLHPWSGAMQAVKEEGENASIKSAMVFIVVMGLISGIITAVAGYFVPPANLVGAGGPKWMVFAAVAVVPLVSFLGSFIGAFIFWGVIDGLLKSTWIEYKTTYRLLAVLAAFPPVSALLSPVPKVGQYLAIAVNVWATIVMIRGIIIVRDTRPLRTWVICGLLFVVLLTLGLAARVATQQQFGGRLPDFQNDLGGLSDDFGDDELEQELNELGDKAKGKAPAKAPAQ